MMQSRGVLSYSTGERIGNFERTDPYSVELWVYPTGTARATALISHIGAGPANPGWMAMMSGTRSTYNQAGFALVNNNATGNFFNILSTFNGISLATNVWHHIVFTYNGNSRVSGVTLYVNGASKALTVVVKDTLTDTIKDNSASLNVGSGTIYPYFPGRIDEAVIYDRVLSAAEVTQRYNAGAGTETLFGTAYLHYCLNESSGTVVPDSSGNLRHGVTIGSPSWVAGKLNNCLQLNGSSQYVRA